MPQAAFDCVIRAGRVGTAVDEFDADIGIKDGIIAAIGRNPGRPAPPRSMPRAGWCCPAASMRMPTSSSSPPPASSMPTPSRAPPRRPRSAAPPRVICFAAQHRGMNLMTVVGDYMALARKGAVDRLHLPHDPHRSDRGHAEGARAGAGGPGPLHPQGVHDLRPAQRRRREAARYPARRAPEQGAGVRARREPRHDLVDGQEAGGEGLHRAQVPHHQPPARLRGRGLQPPHHLRRVHRPADHDLPRLDRRGRRGDPRRRAGAA